MDHAPVVPPPVAAGTLVDRDLVEPEPDEGLAAPLPPTPCRNTAYQYAAWRAVYKPLCRALETDPELVGSQFPPDQSDLDALGYAWQERLHRLRDAGAVPLKGNPAFQRALACRPHAFAYAGEGRPCRFWFCPYCTAADAAELFCRIRRARERLTADGRALYLMHARLLVPRTACREAVRTLLSKDPTRATAIKGIRVLGAHSLRWGTGDSIVRVSLHPVAKFDPEGQRVSVSVRALGSVSSAFARDKIRGLRHGYALERSLKKGMRAYLGEFASGVSKPASAVERCVSEGVFALHGEASTLVQSNEGYPVRATPVADARAAAHLARYPAEVLAGTVEEAAAVVNLAAKVRQSIVRGAFRSVGAVRPSAAPRVFVPISSGAGLVGGLLPGIPGRPEALAARGFARELGLEPLDTFAAIGNKLGWPCHWLGSYDMKAVEQFGINNKHPLADMARLHRPKRPGAHHVLVLSSSIGFQVLWTPGPHDAKNRNGELDLSRLDKALFLVRGYRILRFRYYVATVATFRYLALTLRLTGPLANPATGGLLALTGTGTAGCATESRPAPGQLSLPT